MITTTAAKGSPIRVLDADPELAESLPDDELEEAQLRLLAPTVMLEKGDWAPRRGGADADRNMGVLVVQGLLCREVRIVGRPAAQLIGPGDLVRPWEAAPADALVPHDVCWHVLEEARLALLGPRFATTAAQWPELTTALVARGVRGAHDLAISAAISCTTGLETRLLMLFWQMAERWGRVRADGVVIPVPLTHELIGRLIGARRPSVSTALKQLEREGQLARLHRGGWLLTCDPPQIASPQEGEPELALAGAG